LLYKYVLPKAKSIIVRESTSQKIAEKYNNNVQLYDDFAHEIVDKYKKNISDNGIMRSDASRLDNGQIDNKKLLINLNSYIYNKKTITYLKQIVQKYSDYDKYFVPFDMHDDKKLYHKLYNIIPNLKYFDWTDKTLDEILEFMDGAEV
jgi:hypothetical protein